MVDFIDPNLLAFIAALFISVANTLYRQALGRMSPAMTAMVVNFASALYAFGLYSLEGGLEEWPLAAIFWFALVGITGNSIGRYMNFRSVQLIGLARTSVMIQSILIWTSLLAVFVLGERLTLPIGLGTLAIMLGGVLLVYEGDVRKEKISPLLYLIPVAASFLFGLTFLFRRYGLALIPSAALGMGVATGTAAVCLLGAMLSNKKESAASAWLPRDLAVVAVGALFNVSAAYCFWTSIKLGQIVQVVPIQRLSVLLIIFLSWLFFRKQELVTTRVILGGVLSVAGAFVIVAGK